MKWATKPGLGKAKSLRDFRSGGRLLLELNVDTKFVPSGTSH